VWLVCPDTSILSCCRGKQVALDVAAGLHWLHTHRIVHFDLKVPGCMWGCSELRTSGLLSS
jgi:serine/threonine protein kinase